MSDFVKLLFKERTIQPGHVYEAGEIGKISRVMADQLIERGLAEIAPGPRKKKPVVSKTETIAPPPVIETPKVKKKASSKK
jgi:hypothetical protein